MKQKLMRLGAVFFLAWGLLHIAVGLGGAAAFFTEGPLGALSATDLAIASDEVRLALERAGHIALDFSLILAGYGVLAIWGAVLIWRGQRLGFWLNTVMLGIADAAFVYALMLPGYISVAEGILGPVLYVLGVIFAAMGFPREVQAPSDRVVAAETAT